MIAGRCDDDAIGPPHQRDKPRRNGATLRPGGIIGLHRQVRPATSSVRPAAGRCTVEGRTQGPFGREPARVVPPMPRIRALPSSNPHVELSLLARALQTKHTKCPSCETMFQPGQCRRQAALNPQCASMNGAFIHHALSSGCPKGAPLTPVQGSAGLLLHEGAGQHEIRAIDIIARGSAAGARSGPAGFGLAGRCGRLDASGPCCQLQPSWIRLRPA